MTELEKQGLLAKEAARALSIATTDVKNRALLSIADAREENMGEWLKANQQRLQDYLCFLHL